MACKEGFYTPHKYAQCPVGKNLSFKNAESLLGPVRKVNYVIST